MKEIPLSQGKVAIVDDADFPALSRFKWTFTKGYAFRKIRKGERVVSGMCHCLTHVHMHRVIMNPPIDMEIDHINGDRCDNRRCNLRACTRRQNTRNQISRSPLGFKGVYRHKRDHCVYVMLRDGEGKMIYGGYFADDSIAAARHYDDLAREYHGEFACLNFPRPGERSALTGEIVPQLEESAA